MNDMMIAGTQSTAKAAVTATATAATATVHHTTKDLSSELQQSTFEDTTQNLSLSKSTIGQGCGGSNGATVSSAREGADHGAAVAVVTHNVQATGAAEKAGKDYDNNMMHATSEEDVKEISRKKRNRESAKLSRERKRIAQRNLLSRVKELEKTNKQLSFALAVAQAKLSVLSRSNSDSDMNSNSPNTTTNGCDSHKVASHYNDNNNNNNNNDNLVKMASGVGVAGTLTATATATASTKKGKGKGKGSSSTECNGNGDTNGQMMTSPGKGSMKDFNDKLIRASRTTTFSTCNGKGVVSARGRKQEGNLNTERNTITALEKGCNHEPAVLIVIKTLQWYLIHKNLL